MNPLLACSPSPAHNVIARLFVGEVQSPYLTSFDGNQFYWIKLMLVLSGVLRKPYSLMKPYPKVRKSPDI